MIIMSKILRVVIFFFFSCIHPYVMVELFENNPGHWRYTAEGLLLYLVYPGLNSVEGNDLWVRRDYLLPFINIVCVYS